jgi:uncharacterized protein YkwD
MNVVNMRFAIGVVLAGVLACGAPARRGDDVGTSGFVAGPGSAIVEFVNAERKRAGLKALSGDDRLAKAAQLHANQIATAGRLEHTLPRARYPRMQDRLAATGYKWRAIGENLAAGQSSAAQAVSGWMSSPPHRANILNTTFTETGGAVAFDRKGRAYYVQVFGTSR